MYCVQFQKFLLASETTFENDFFSKIKEVIEKNLFVKAIRMQNYDQFKKAKEIIDSEGILNISHKEGYVFQIFSLNSTQLDKVMEILSHLRNEGVEKKKQIKNERSSQIVYPEYWIKSSSYDEVRVIDVS